MPFVYKQVELQKMEWCSKDTMYRHLDRFVPIYITRANGKISKRYLDREDSLIYRAWLEATRQKRIKSFCETAFEQEYEWEIPAVEMCIIAHYNDGRVFDKIYYQWEEVEKINRINWLQALLNKLTRECYPPFDFHKRYIQEFSDKETELFWISKWKKRWYKAGSRIIIDWFGRRHR